MDGKLKVLLVRPPRIKQAVTLGEFMFSEPIGLEIVYTILKDICDVKILDLMIKGENLVKTLEEFKPDIVGITSLCIDVNKVIDIAMKTKKYNQNIITLAGGTQAYLNPSSYYHESIDHVFKYTTRENLLTFIEQVGRGGIVSLIDGVHSKCNEYRSTNVQGRNEYIVPDRTSTKQYRKHYSYLGFKPCAIMQTSLGCSKHCEFCLRWRLEGARENDIQMECVIEQIKAIEEPSIMIYDNDFLNNKDRLEEFCDILEKENIKKNFICYSSVKSVLSHPETIKRVHKNGLKAVLIGYETFNQEELAKYKKKSTASDSLEASQVLKNIGIDAWASFILHPDWDKKDFNKFRAYVKSLKPEISTFSPLTPFPGLPLYKEYKDRLLFDITDYESWSFSKVSIMPSKMSLRSYYYEVLKTVLYINLRMNSAPYMIKRFGIMTLLRITKGSLKVFAMYVKLMADC